MTRNQMVAGAMALVVGAGAIGWAVGASITSPAEAAANAAPPTPSLITVAVDQRLLSADIVARGSIDYDDPVGLGLSGTVGETGSPQIVTMIPEEGTELPEGAVVLEVAGRPVLLLQGELPVYRDMRPGSSGDDVLQLEQALVRLGLMSSADERWDNATGAGVQALYARAGYIANATSKTDQDALKAARDQVRAANEALQDAIRALNESGGASGSGLIEAQNAVADAQAAVAVANADRVAAVGAATGTLTVAQATRDSVVGDLASTPEEIAAAEAAVVDAQNNLVATQTAQDALVAAAERNLALAKARLAEAQNPGDLTSLIRARDEARRQLADATTALQDIESTVGTWLPAGELIFLKRMPVQVARNQATRGEVVSGDFMTVSGSDIAMTIGLSEADAKRVEIGNSVIIEEPDLLEEPMTAEVADKSEPSSSGRVTLTVLLDSVPETLLGANVRVTIPIESTSDEVLVVPAAALSAVANGDTRVEVEDPDNPGKTRFVTVSTGLAADGVVEVTPLDGELKKGDRVVVGQADIGPAGGDSDDPSSDPSDDAEQPEESEDSEG
jgi:multidrug efflux pump subunit AcrA (membrane-fusion protein)